MDLTFIVPIAGLAALGFAAYLAWDVLRQGRGTDEMKEISDAIMEGAKAFLKRQYTTIAILAGIFAAIFAVAISANDLLAGKPLEIGLRTGLMTAGAALREQCSKVASEIASISDELEATVDSIPTVVMNYGLVPGEELNVAAGNYARIADEIKTATLRIGTDLQRIQLLAGQLRGLADALDQLGESTSEGEQS